MIRTVVELIVVQAIGLATGWYLEAIGYNYVFRGVMWVFFNVGV